MPVGWRHSLSLGSPPDSTIEYTRDGLFIRELKYEVVYATKVVGEHSHPTLWVRGLTNSANKMEFAFADDCQKGSQGTTDVA